MTLALNKKKKHDGKKAPFPEFFKPMLATLVDNPLKNPGGSMKLNGMAIAPLRF
jgi:hypothetical protein